mgnify:CR=1 FL=1
MHFLKDTLRESVEAATGGKVTVLYDDKGYPSYMNVIPKFKVEDIDASLGTGVHPAFIVGGVEKFQGYTSEGYRIWDGVAYDEYDEPIYNSDPYDDTHPFKSDGLGQ